MNVFEGQYWQGPDGNPAVGALITFSSDPAGLQPIATYDLTGASVQLVTSADPPGWMPQFQADALQGYLSAGSQSTLRLAMNYIADRLSQLDNLQGAATAAASDAASAVQLASQAQQSAGQAQVATNPLQADSGISQAQFDAL